MNVNPLRYLWIALGLISVGLGFVGFIVPGMPGTVFFVIAAWLFSKSSPRFLNWLLGLPVAGALIRDYRSGLGMPLAAKYIAISMMSVAVLISVLFFIPSVLFKLGAVVLWAIGAWVIWYQVPTRELVLQARKQK